MWAGGAISDEDRLDRAETGRVLRRSLQFAQPYRRTIWWAVALVCASTVCTLAGPVFVKFGLDHGINYVETDFAAEVHRLTDGRGADVIVIESVPGDDAWLAVRDRLARATQGEDDDRD